jgi:hypothetical protein
VGVARQIIKRVLSRVEGRLGIDDPVLPIKRAQEEGEVLVLMKRQSHPERSAPAYSFGSQFDQAFFPEITRLS